MHLPSQRSGFLAVGGVLVAGTLLMAGLDDEAASSMRAGMCVDADIEPAACADPAAVYQVLTTADSGSAGCPDGDYFAERAGGGLLCLGHNAAAGDCVQDDPEGPTLVPCRAETTIPTIRVLQVVDGQDTAKACRTIEGDAVRALTYSVPARTMCLVHQPLTTAG